MAKDEDLGVVVNNLQAEIERLRAALNEIIFTDDDPKAIATKALGWVRVDQQQPSTEKPEEADRLYEGDER